MLVRGLVYENEMDGACGTHGRKEKCTGFWWESPKERDHLKDHGADNRVGLEMDLRGTDLGGGRCGVDSHCSG
jgi:hypothetical protein